MGTMHFAKLETSERLQTVYDFLKEGIERTSREIAVQCESCAPGTDVSELRHNGLRPEYNFDVNSRLIDSSKKRRVYGYTLIFNGRES